MPPSNHSEIDNDIRNEFEQFICVLLADSAENHLILPR
jgi:hypothetical protein